MLHDVVEDTAWTVDDVRDRFGGTVASLVGAVTEDSTIRDFRRRKRALREQIAGAGPAAADIALADKVASLRHAVDTGVRVPRRKLSHYAATVEMADNPGHPALAAEAGRLLTVLAERERAGRRRPGSPRRPGFTTR